MLWNCKDYRLLALIICEVGLSEQLQKQRGEAGHSPVGGGWVGGVPWASQPCMPTPSLQGPGRGPGNWLGDA